MKFLRTLILVLGIIGILQAQDKPRVFIDIPVGQKPWNNLEWNDDPDKFQFAIVTDRTGGHRPGVFSEGIRKLNLLQPEFVMSVGDLIEGYTKDEKVLDQEWEEFTGFIEELEAPFFYVPGNHDITNQVMEEKWKELFGVTYYHFVYKDVLFLCLNSEDNYRGAGKGTIDEAQYDYIQKVLADNQNVKWTLVFLHQPLWVQNDTKRWKDVEALLSNRPHNVFAGHYHRYWKTEKNNGKYIALATTGGGSRLRGPGYGEFDHVVWVTMTDEGPLLANLLLDGIWDENVVTDDLVDLVRNKPFPVEIDPAFVNVKTPKNSETQLRITNDSDYPMQVALSGHTHPNLYYHLENTAIEVAPNDVAFVQLEVINIKQADISTLDPITINAEITYDYQGTEVVFDNDLLYLPLYKYIIPKKNQAIKIDGQLNEWPSEWITAERKKGSPFDHTGTKDCSVKFASATDDQFLYLAISVSDDEFYINPKAAHWNQDVIIVGLDGRKPAISIKNNGAGRNRDWMALLLTFKEEDPIYEADRLPEGFTYKVTRSENGANIELAIPQTYLNKKQMEEWKTIRLGVGYYDFDEAGESRTEHFWYPAWNTAESFPGSGLMFRE